MTAWVKHILTFELSETEVISRHLERSQGVVGFDVVLQMSPDPAVLVEVDRAQVQGHFAAEGVRLTFPKISQNAYLYTYIV